MDDKTPVHTIRGHNWAHTQLMLAAHRAAGFTAEQVGLPNRNIDEIAIYREALDDPYYAVKQERVFAYSGALEALGKTLNEAMGAAVTTVDLRYSKSRNKMCLAFIMDDDFQERFAQDFEKERGLPDTTSESAVDAYNEQLREAFETKVTAAKTLLHDKGLDVETKAFRSDAGRYLGIEVGLDESLLKLNPGKFGAQEMPDEPDKGNSPPLLG